MAELAGQAACLAAMAFLSSRFSLPSRLLDGINTYVTQDSIGGAAAVRRPSDGGAAADSGPQLLRLRLVDSHLRSRLFFPDYRRCFVSAASAASALLLALFLLRQSSQSHLPPSIPQATVPISSSLLATLQISSSLARSSLQRSSDKQLAAFISVLGFLAAILLRSALEPPIFDFLPEVAISASAGVLAGVLFLPAVRSARSLWLGTDQLRWNLDFAVSGKISLFLFYASFVAGVAAPIASFREPTEIKTLILAGSAILKLMAIRADLQAYLNEAVLSWYQMLHGGKVLAMDQGRAKIFLHNHNLCLAVVQFFAPPALEILLVGVAQTAAFFPGAAASAAAAAALFFAWWISLVHAVFSLSTLVFLRCGFLILS
ncbi:transmembrane protein 161AB protein [Wolffia australiana]